MNSEIQIFNNGQFGEIRTQNIDNQAYFVAADLCKTLGYSNTRDAIIRHVDKDDVVKHDIATPIVSQGLITGKHRKVAMVLVNESGLYSLIFGSKLPQAKQFTRWVTSEVLPTIRKHGAYFTPEKLQMIVEGKENILKIADQIRKDVEEKEYYREQLGIQIEAVKESAPKVEFFDNAMQSSSTYVVHQIAKELGMSAVRLNKELEKRKIQFKSNGQWLLYSRYADKDYTKSKTHIYNQRDGNKGTNVQTVWTEKGRYFLHTLFQKS